MYDAKVVMAYGQTGSKGSSEGEGKVEGKWKYTKGTSELESEKKAVDGVAQWVGNRSCSFV